MSKADLKAAMESLQVKKPLQLQWPAPSLSQGIRHAQSRWVRLARDASFAYDHCIIIDPNGSGNEGRPQ
jgi:hypothetical protein